MKSPPQQAAGYQRECGMGLLPLGYFLLPVTHGRRLALRLIADGSLVNTAVPDSTADLRRFIESSLLGVTGEYSTLYANPIHTYIMPQSSAKRSYRDINRATGICRLHPSKALDRRRPNSPL